MFFFPQSSAHLLYFFEVLLGGQKLLVLKLILERGKCFDAVRLEESLHVSALRSLFARRLRSFLLETVRERHLGNVIQSHGGGTSGIVERENAHFLLLLRCGVCCVVLLFLLLLAAVMVVVVMELLCGDDACVCVCVRVSKMEMRKVSRCILCVLWCVCALEL